MKRGQVWVETVIYTLIALILISLVLAFVRPKILELQDKATLDQSVSMLNNVNNVISSVSEGGPGNKREVDITLKAGSLLIDGVDNLLMFNMQSNYAFSEPGRNVSYGDIVVYTLQKNNLNLVNMTLTYNQYNITYNGGNTQQTITSSSTPYRLFITNNGGSKTNIDFTLG